MTVSVRNTGFTLIELMIVIAIAAILAAIATPSMNSMAANRLADRLHQELELDLRYTRSQASTTGKVFAFEPLSNWQDGWKITDMVTNQIVRQRNHNLSNDTITSSDISTGSPLIFSPNGRTNTEANIKVSVSGCSGDRIRTLFINRIGQIQITGVSTCP